MISSFIISHSFLNLEPKYISNSVFPYHQHPQTIQVPPKDNIDSVPEIFSYSTQNLKDQEFDEKIKKVIKIKQDLWVKKTTVKKIPQKDEENELCMITRESTKEDDCLKRYQEANKIEEILTEKNEDKQKQEEIIKTISTIQERNESKDILCENLSLSWKNSQSSEQIENLNYIPFNFGGSGETNQNYYTKSQFSTQFNPPNLPISSIPESHTVSVQTSCENTLSFRSQKISNILLPLIIHQTHILSKSFCKWKVFDRSSSLCIILAKIKENTLKNAFLKLKINKDQK